MTTESPIAVYGANGHTGRFVVAELRRRGLACRAVGRNAVRMRGLGADEFRVAPIDDRAMLGAAFEGAGVIINCAGPFLDTAPPVIRAAIDAGVHYLDVTAEQQSVRDSYRDFDSAAKQAGVKLLPAAGFFGGLADLLVALAMAEWSQADAARIAVALDSWHPTEGTRATGRRNSFARVVLRDSRLVALGNETTPESWRFPAPFGVKPIAPVQLSEIITIARQGRIDNLDSYMVRSALDDLADPATSAPTPIDEHGRSAQRFLMDVETNQADAVRRASASGQDIYAITAPLVVEATERILKGDTTATGGAFSLAELFDPHDFLGAIAAVYPGFQYRTYEENRR